MNDQRVITCEEALRFLTAYLDKELEAATESEIESHLARCRSCYSRAEFEKHLKGRLVLLGRSELRPEFADRIRRLLARFTASPDTSEL